MSVILPSICPPEVAALIHGLVERAERGEIEGLAIAYATRDGCDASAYEIGASDIARLVLGLERCKLRLMGMQVAGDGSPT